MNIPSANEDNDFPVFKAGPPLPIRAKGKPHFKTKTTAPLKATNISVISGQSQSQTTNLKSGSSNSSVKINSGNNTESKVKQYIERVKANDEQGRRKRLKPEQMLSLEELYQVNLDESTSGKVNTNKSEENDDSSSTLRIDKPLVSAVQEKLRETMRILKEKDELINKLRESCHDLAIKCADAENRVDELRFSYGRSSSNTQGRDVRKGAGFPTSETRASICGDTALKGNNSNQQQLRRRCASAEGLLTSRERENESFPEVEDKSKELKGKVDKATEISNEIHKQDAHTQVEHEAGKEELALEGVGHWREEDEILQETCSNWMEKVQNWKTDSNFNLSQDSGGDRDSGFRSSAEVDNESIRRQQRLILHKSQKIVDKPSERPKTVEKSINPSQIPVPEEAPSSSMTMTITASRRASASASASASKNFAKAPEEHQGVEGHRHQHFWPSYTSSQSFFHLDHLENFAPGSDSTKSKSLFYELAEAERNKYEYFQEGFNVKNSNQSRRRLHGAKSLDVLYYPQTAHHRTKEDLRSLIDSSFDPPEFILKSHLNSQHRSIDKKVKMLDPLLDDATQIALRVKHKSERLAKMLQDACTFD